MIVMNSNSLADSELQNSRYQVVPVVTQVTQNETSERKYDDSVVYVLTGLGVLSGLFILGYGLVL